jgi:lysophospholipase L1-like esterase
MLHILIALLILKTDSYERARLYFGFAPNSNTATHFYRATLSHQLKIDGNINSESFIFFGDSMIQGLNTSAIVDNSVNFGIGHDTSEALLQRLPQYQATTKAKHIFIAIGVNDVNLYPEKQSIRNILKLFEAIPNNTQVYVSGVLPVSQNHSPHKNEHQSKVNKINTSLQNILSNFDKITYIPPPLALFDKKGYLKAKLHSGDGLHLNALGYEIWIEHLKRKLARNEK